MRRVLVSVLLTLVVSPGGLAVAQDSGDPASSAGEGTGAGGEVTETVSDVAITVGEIQLETAPAMTALVLPVTGSYEQHSAVLQQLMMTAGPAGVIRGAPFGVYVSDPETVAMEELEWAVGVPVAAEATAEPPFELRQVPERQVASVMCTGPYEANHACFEALFAWIQANGLQPAGPPEEHWLSDPQTTPPEAIQTRILVPVAPL